MYNLGKDIKKFTKRIRLREYFYSDEKLDEDYSDMPAFRKKAYWCPTRNCEMVIEAYVEALERKILSHGSNVPYQRRM